MIYFKFIFYILAFSMSDTYAIWFDEYLGLQRHDERGKRAN